MIPISPDRLAAVGAAIGVPDYSVQVRVDSERRVAEALELSDEEFEEVWALCRRLASEQPWDSRVLLAQLHERVMIRGGASQWRQEYWEVPHLWMLPALER